MVDFLIEWGLKSLVATLLLSAAFRWQMSSDAQPIRHRRPLRVSATIPTALAFSAFLSSWSVTLSARQNPNAAPALNSTGEEPPPAKQRRTTHASRPHAAVAHSESAAELRKKTGVGKSRTTSAPVIADRPSPTRMK